MKSEELLFHVYDLWMSFLGDFFEQPEFAGEPRSVSELRDAVDSCGDGDELGDLWPEIRKAVIDSLDVGPLLGNGSVVLGVALLLQEVALRSETYFYESLYESADSAAEHQMEQWKAQEELAIHAQRMLSVKYRASDMERLAKQGIALDGGAFAGGAFPIVDAEDLRAAVNIFFHRVDSPGDSLSQHQEDEDRVKADRNSEIAMSHIVARAAAIGAEDLVPNHWVPIVEGVNVLGPPVKRARDWLPSSDQNVPDWLKEAILDKLNTPVVVGQPVELPDDVPETESWVWTDDARTTLNFSKRWRELDPKTRKKWRSRLLVAHIAFRLVGHRQDSNASLISQVWQGCQRPVVLKDDDGKPRQGKRSNDLGNDAMTNPLWVPHSLEQVRTQLNELRALFRQVADYPYLQRWLSRLASSTIPSWNDDTFDLMADDVAWTGTAGRPPKTSFHEVDVWRCDKCGAECKPGQEHSTQGHDPQLVRDEYGYNTTPGLRADSPTGFRYLCLTEIGGDECWRRQGGVLRPITHSSPS